MPARVRAPRITEHFQLFAGVSYSNALVIQPCFEKKPKNFHFFGRFQKRWLYASTMSIHRVMATFLLVIRYSYQVFVRVIHPFIQKFRI